MAMNEGLFDFKLMRVEKAPPRDAGWYLQFTCGCAVHYGHEMVMAFQPGPACQFDVKLSEKRRKDR